MLILLLLLPTIYTTFKTHKNIYYYIAANKCAAISPWEEFSVSIHQKNNLFVYKLNIYKNIACIYNMFCI